MKIGYKTQFFQPLRTPLANKIDYYKYIWKHNPVWKRILLTVIMAGSAISLILNLMNYFSWPPFLKALFIIGLVGPAILIFLDYAKHYDDRFTSEETDPNAYSQIDPPNGNWKRLMLKVADKEETVFLHDGINEWLRGGTDIAMQRDKKYEKGLKKAIRKENVWEKTYSPFLRHNHRDAMYTGKQFYNESKFGLSSEFDEGAGHITVHRTCYFDNYLTNIIPGKKLISNLTGEVVAKTYPDLMPYHVDSRGKRKLYHLDEKRVSNMLGVSTLCILPNGNIRLWRQNGMTQGSNNLYAASGSGSADWNDCKHYFKDCNGFRRAVVHAMERELWEESHGTREISFKEFSKNVDTRITGYFRWLTKGGKPEFVGLTRLNDISSVNRLSPELSEVYEARDLPAETVEELLKSLKREVDFDDEKRNAQISKQCNVSCTMAMYALRELCREYCRAKCSVDDPEKDCNKGECKEKPFDVLFPDEPTL